MLNLFKLPFAVVKLSAQAAERVVKAAEAKPAEVVEAKSSVPFGFQR